jgi:outer membrane protein assembly factor BamB
MFDPRERSQPIAFFAFLFVTCLLLCGGASAAPSITLSKKSGPPTSKILVSGRGFEANVGVDIFFDTKDKALVVTNGQGEFHDAGIHAPRSARPGKHWVTSLERNNDKGAQQPFLVRTDWSEFHFDADGTRLNPYENVLNPSTVSGLGLQWSYSTLYYQDSSMAIADGVVYVGPKDSYVYALNARTGDLLWSYLTYSASGLSSPAVASGVVYVGDFLYAVYALNARTGSLLWAYLTGTSVMSSPAVANGVVYVGSRDYNVYALNARTGDKLWSYPTGSWVDSSPAVANGVVYVGSFDKNVYALNARTGAKLWSYATGGSVESSPVVANGTVYVGSDDNNLYALNARTGTKLWNYATGNAVVSSPAVANGIVYVGSEDYNLYALNGSTGALLWTYSKGIFFSSPAVANGVVYVGSLDGNVYALNARTGTKLWRYTTGDGVASSPAVANGMVYVGSLDFNVYAFSLTHAEGERGQESPEAASNRPGLRTLHPDLNLKESKPDATPSAER